VSCVKKKDEGTLLLPKQKEAATAKIKEYVLENFDVELGNLQSEFFLDFITEHIGVHYYNKAIADAQAFVTDKVEDMYLLMKDEPQ